MQIKTISGMLNAKGKYINENEYDFFDFIELKLSDGTYIKLLNVIVAKDCSRGLKNGNGVTLVLCDSPDARSKHFPSNLGLTTIYAVYSETDNRVFDDVNVLNGQIGALDSSLKKVRVLMWGFVAFLVWGALRDPKAFLLCLFGGVVPLGIYFLQYRPIKKLRAMSATADEIRPYVDSLRKLVKLPVQAELQAA